MKAAPHFSRHGGVLLMTLSTLAALTLVAAYTMLRVSPKFQAAHQTAAWQEARLAAEAGVDAAMGDLVKNATGQTPGTWPGWKQQNGAPAGTVLAGLLSPITNLLNSLLGPPAPGTTTTTSTAPIFLDNVNISSGSGILTAVDVQLWGPRQTDTQRYWFRIRSMATCAIPPVAYKTAEKLDGPLRRLSLRQVRAQLGKDDVGDRMGIPTPSASRIVEVLVEPILPFELALWTDRALSLGTSGTWGVDSYDSRDPQKNPRPPAPIPAAPARRCRSTATWRATAAGPPTRSTGRSSRPMARGCAAWSRPMAATTRPPPSTKTWPGPSRSIPHGCGTIFFAK